MTDDIEMFTSTGALRSDFSDAEILALPEERKGLFFKLVEAATAERDAVAKDTSDTAELHASVRAMDVAANANRIANPPPDRIDELRRQIRANNRALGIPNNEEPKAKTRKNDPTLKALDEATTRAERARTNALASSADLRVKRKALASAILAWQSAGTPRDFATVHQEHLARIRQREMDIISGKTIVEEGPPEIIPSHLDAFRRRGKGDTINLGYRNMYPSFKRGTRVKLPSQR